MPAMTFSSPRARAAAERAAAQDVRMIFKRNVRPDATGRAIESWPSPPWPIKSRFAVDSPLEEAGFEPPVPLVDRPYRDCFAWTP
jgi:hypothetical protein